MASNVAQGFKLHAELVPTEEAEQLTRLAYHENMRQAILLLLDEVAKLRNEVNTLRGL